MENFSPNQTKFTVQRADPVSRYRFSLSARTQVGSGEAVTEESPAPPNEGRCTAAAEGRWSREVQAPRETLSWPGLLG